MSDRSSAHASRFYPGIPTIETSILQSNANPRLGSAVPWRGGKCIFDCCRCARLSLAVLPSTKPFIYVDFFAWKYQGDWLVISDFFNSWRSEILSRNDRSFNPEFWPDPAEMAAKVKALTGAEMMVSLWPSMEDLSVNYLPTQMKGLLATTKDGTGISDSFAGVYTRLSEPFVLIY